MAKISTYPIDGVVSGADKVIGTDADDSNATKNFTVSSLAAFILGPINLQYVLDAGNSADQNIVLTGNANAIMLSGSTSSIEMTGANSLIQQTGLNALFEQTGDTASISQSGDSGTISQDRKSTRLNSSHSSVSRMPSSA